MTNCSSRQTALRPGRSPSMRLPHRSGPGLRRWGRRRAAAPTPTTGSKTCSDSTCTASTWSCPEFQRPEIGDTIGYGPNRMRVERVEPEHVLAWRSKDGNWVWTFVLEEHYGAHPIDQPQPLPTSFTRARRSEWLRWNRLHSSWNGRCSTASNNERNGLRPTGPRRSWRAMQLNVQPLVRLPPEGFPRHIRRS